MRRLALVVPLLAASACSTPDPCAGRSGTCITAHVAGNAQNLTSVRVTLPDQRMTVTQSASGAIKLPAQFAIVIATDVPASPFDVQLDGIRGSDVVASDTRSVTLANMRARVDFTLDEAGGGGSGGDGGGGSGPDMAVMNPPVVSPLTPLTVDELQAISLDLTATDPLGGTVSLSAAQLPGNATFTPTATGGTLKWTPGYTDAGAYTVKITATPSDPMRVATYDLPITIKNAADPIVVGGSPALGAVPIGDWDKDGFGDIAVCTGDAAGATGKYHIKIVYGAATGLPLDAAGQAARTDSFDISATNLGGSQYSCKGGDYDGDGHADIIFSDPLNDYWHALNAMDSPAQGKLTIIFGGARGVAPPTNFVVGNENFGQHLGMYFSVGDFTGDGKADIGTVWDLNATTYALIIGGARMDQTQLANELDYSFSNYVCHDPISVDFTDFDGDGKADWVVQDPGINLGATTETTCGAMHMAAGGLRVIKGRNTAPLLQDMTGDEGTRWEMYYAPTTVAANLRVQWAEVGAGCDVDNDGKGDLGVLLPFNGVNAHGSVYYGSATGIAATAKTPLADAAGNNFDFATQQVAKIGCARSYMGGKQALVVSEGSMSPGALHFFGGKPLTQLGTMSSPDAGDSGFGVAIRSGNKTDVDGDGKEDLIVISNQFGWVIYGR